MHLLLQRVRHGADNLLLVDALVGRPLVLHPHGEPPLNPLIELALPHKHFECLDAAVVLVPQLHGKSEREGERDVQAMHTPLDKVPAHSTEGGWRDEHFQAMPRNGASGQTKLGFVSQLGLRGLYHWPERGA